MITLQKVYKVAGVLTNVTSFKVWVKRNDTNADVVGTSGSPAAMTNVSTGVYVLSFAEPAYNLLYTATYSYNDGVTTKTFPNLVIGSSPSGLSGNTLTVGLADLQAELAALYFGQEQIPPYSVLTTGSPSPLTANQVLQVNRCIRDGMMSVYAAWRWSFLRPRITISTIAPYSTGTVTVNAGGVVTLVYGTAPTAPAWGVTPPDGGFPTNAASGNGMVYVPSSSTTGFVGGSWFVGTYTSATQITLAGYTGGAIPAASIMLAVPASGNYTLSWNGNTTGSIAPNAPAATIQTAPQSPRRRCIHRLRHLPQLLRQRRRRQSAHRRQRNRRACRRRRALHPQLQPLPAPRRVRDL